jgi:hypothetical protein
MREAETFVSRQGQVDFHSLVYDVHILLAQDADVFDHPA